MAYNTGNPIGSLDPRDAADNKENFDRFAVSSARTYTDRLGVERKTVTGTLQDYAAYNLRGVWTTATAYNVNDVWRDGAAGAFYLVLADYTSGVSAAADIASGNVAVHQPKDWVVSVATIADLRNLEPAFDGQQVELLGHTVAGVGGGMFYADYSSSATDDNGITVVTSGGKRWVRKGVSCAFFSHFGGTESNTSNNKSVLSSISQLGLDIVIDIPVVDFGALLSGDFLFDITSALSGKTLSGPAKFLVSGPTNNTESSFFRPNGVNGFKIIDIEIEDTANTANTTGRSGVHYCYADNLSSSSESVSLVRPVMRGGVSLLTTRDEGAGNTHNNYFVDDGEVIDSYYGINTANCGNNLTANITTRRVKRSYFPYGIHGHRVYVTAIDQSAANAHCLIKSYGTTTRDIVLDFKTQGSDSTAGGIVVLEHNDGTNPNSVIEDIDIRVSDTDGTKNFTLLFRSFDGSSNVMTSNIDAITRNISVSGHTGGRLPLAYGGENNPITVSYRAINGNFGVSELLRTSVARQPNSGLKHLHLKLSENTWYRYGVGDGGDGAEVDFIVSGLIGIGTSFVARVLARASANTTQVSGAQQTTEEFLVLGAVDSSGNVSISQQLKTNSISNGTPIPISLSASGKSILLSASVTDDNGWLSGKIEFI